MITSSSIIKTIIPALLLSLLSSSAFSQGSGESISVKARSAPHSGIEQMNTYCTLRADAETSKEIYDGFPELSSMIESALERNFQAKGFSRAASGACDIEMRYAVALQEQRQLSGQKYRSTAVESGMDEKGKLRMGQLDLNAYNKAQSRKIWTGQAANTEGVYINLNKPEEQDMAGVRNRVNVAVDKLFMRFPARAK
ncbi:MAG: DUF4136 domain-containing protein [Gammaproteobacteria bacterium]|nr:MAG: DUF4136 domain-containing protein [Gammaproteobacteria bacterium]